MKMMANNVLFVFAALTACSAQFIPSSGPVYINHNNPVPVFDAPEAPVGDRTTQTVYGFLDFTTTIGNTVMVFSPQSAAAERKTEKPTERPVIETRAPPTTPPKISPSKTFKPETPSVEEEKPETRQSVENAPIFSVVEIIDIDVSPSKSQQPPVVLSSKIEIKESPPVKIKKPSQPPVSKVEIREESPKFISSRVEIRTDPTKLPGILSSKVEVVTNDKPVISSKVEVITNQKPLSSIVQILTNEDEDEPAVELEANNIDKPEYDFLNRQPSEIVDESYKVIDLRPNSKFHLKPKTRQLQNGGKDTRTTGLVTKMGGTIVKDGLTTVHETQVIGTYISGKYAQVLQSTQKVLPKAQKIAPTQTARILKTAAPSFPKSRVQLEPTPAGSLHEETALPLEALFHGDKSHVRPSRRPGPAVGGPAGKNDVKSRYRSRPSKELDTQEVEDDYEEPKRKFKPSAAKSSFRSPKSSGVSQLPTVSVYSESTVSPSGRKYQNGNRRTQSNNSNNFKAKANHEKDDTSARRSYKPKIQTSSPDSPGGSTSLYKFKLQRPSGRWQYKTTPKPRVTIRGREDQQNEVTSPAPSPQFVPGDDNDAERREDFTGEESHVEPSATASTIKVSISTPPDFSDLYYEIATIKSPYVFQGNSNTAVLLHYRNLQFNCRTLGHFLLLFRSLVDAFENDGGNEEGVNALEAAALAVVLRTTSAQLHILFMGSAAPTTIASHSVRENLLTVFEESEISLRAKGSFSSLFLSAREAADRMQEEQWLEDLAARNKETITSLRAKLQGNQRAKQRELHKKQEVIASLKDQIQELVSKRDVTLSYVERSFASRREQSLLRNENTEQDLKSKLESLKDRTDNERSVHDSLISFLNHSFKDMHMQIEKWTDFHNAEMIRRNNKLKTIRIKISEEKAKLADLTDLYDEHQREINEYLEYKEQKRLEAERDQFIYDTATKIQAWWRGNMVRRGLGPYKKRKKPAKDKKKKK